MTLTDLCRCEHPEAAHDAGTCWTHPYATSHPAEPCECTGYDPPVLRSCLVDGCGRQFDLAAWMDSRYTAPPELSGAGWVRLGRSIRYLCPDHADWTPETGEQQ